MVQFGQKMAKIAKKREIFTIFKSRNSCELMQGKSLTEVTYPLLSSNFAYRTKFFQVFPYFIREKSPRSQDFPNFAEILRNFAEFCGPRNPP